MTSTRAKIVFVTSIVFTTSVISFVHYQHHQDRIAMHAGVVREENDLLRKRQLQNTKMLEEQQVLKIELEKRDARNFEEKA